MKKFGILIGLTAIFSVASFNANAVTTTFIVENDSTVIVSHPVAYDIFLTGTVITPGQAATINPGTANQDNFQAVNTAYPNNQNLTFVYQKGSYAQQCKFKTVFQIVSGAPQYTNTAVSTDNNVTKCTAALVTFNPVNYNYTVKFTIK